MSLKSLASEISSLIESEKINSFHELNLLKLKLSKKHSVKKLPSNPDILALVENPSIKCRKLLSIKETRSISGVEVCAVMVKKHECPGRCIYCSAGIGDAETPQSYTGKEPSAMRGLMFNFDAFRQTENRIRQLDAIGHEAKKIELIVMGGTFASMPYSYQKNFVKRCLEAITEKKANSLEQAKLNAEKSARRVVGITFESRPDFCGKKEINRFLELGGTRIELGVQLPDNRVYALNHRGHKVKDVINATQLLKDSAFKVCFHLMPGLYGSDSKNDLKKFTEIFSNPDFKPDMVKIYPCLVIKGTKLHELYADGKYLPLDDMHAVKLISKLSEFIPPWVRVMRIQRDIPANVIEAGVKKSNLRQLVEAELEAKGKKCGCIRCRETGIQKRLGKEFNLNEFRLFSEKYDASKGKEYFISFESEKKDVLAGFARLRIPFSPFRKELDFNTALIRELHVFGESLALGERKEEATQHKGIGKMLLEKAEEIACNEGMKKISVISGLGVKEYYLKNFNYRKEGEYVSKKL